MSLTILEWYCITYSVTHVTELVLIYNKTMNINDSLREVFANFPTVVVVVFLCLIVGGFVTKLFIYHIKIICKS